MVELYSYCFMNNEYVEGVCNEKKKAYLTRVGNIGT